MKSYSALFLIKTTYQSLILFVLILSYSLSSFSQQGTQQALGSQSNNSASMSAQQRYENQQAQQIQNSANMPQTRQPKDVSAPSIKDSAAENSSMNMIGQVVSMVMGAGLTGMAVGHSARCNSDNKHECFEAAIKFGMAAQSFMQAASHGQTAAAAGNTASMTDGSGLYTYSNLDGNPYGDKNPNSPFYNDPNLKSLKANQDKLNKSGFKFDPAKGTVTANGKTYKASDFSSAQSLAAAGFSADQISKAMSDVNALEKAALTKLDKIKLGALTNTNGYASGGGGGGAMLPTDDNLSGGGASALQSYSGVIDPRSALGLNERDPANVPNIQKSFNGDPIGVSVDSIFSMMSRRYKVKERQDSFL